MSTTNPHSTDNTDAAGFPPAPPETHQRAAGGKGQGAGEGAETREHQPPTGRDVTIALHQLRLSPANVRKQRDDQGIPELAALIRSQGLLQRPSITDAGDGTFSVEAGGRRLAACQWLVADGFYAEGQPIECRLYDSSHAVAISMAENSGRLNMHPADEFEAFALLIAQGRTVKQVADQFGVSVLTVERRMKLANLAPRFIQLFREGAASMDQLKVLCLVDDHALQSNAWDSLHEYNRTAYMLRQALVNDDEVEGDSSLARFVGIEAYEAAGGLIRRDLFSESTEACWLQDGALVQQLATARLDEVAEEERAAGWSWVEARLHTDYATMQAFGRERAKSRKMTEDEAKALDDWRSLAAEAHASIAALEDEYASAEEGSAAEEALAKRIEQAEADAENIEVSIAIAQESLAQWSDKQLATCGAIVTLSRSGQVEITRGLMRPQDRKAIVADLKKAGKPIPAGLQSASPGKGERAALSERLMHDLTAHRTAALQAALTENAHVALALVVHKLAAPIFASGYFQSTSPLKLSAHLTANTSLSSRATEYGDSQAAAVLERAREAWGDRLPGGDGEASMLPWFIKQDRATLMELLAFCSASMLDAMQGRERTASDDSDVLAEALGVDMADWWTPTPAKYLESVSKAQLIEAVTEARDGEVARLMTGMKKGEAIAYAAAKLEGTRWLPLPLRPMCAPSKA
ncbi:ParB/RepB/Spo0J family partition protein [Variovorax sp. J22P168]|uniref:ParB/RepB/Spo0J family partition protein n=1 Tax=Variovorax jilinensis TaxID=3053513 RepID=UPI002574D17C|nr:ParB/RepB/Spo0J family partition protein [Variovorax sp. J22P168]MDM0015845.1 ParB/RepB/Spo0J family partition protein [Variovorax sp. J22P168]